jgi:hypothetical protein
MDFIVLEAQNFSRRFVDFRGFRSLLGCNTLTVKGDIDMKKHLLFPAAALLVCLAAFAAGNKPQSGIDTKAAYARLRTLVGQWEANTSMGKARLSIELIGNGTALVERESFDQMPGMETVYYPDGDRLLLTHYCMVGNQPRMQASAYNAQTGELKFEFLDATNLNSPAAGHMHNATFHFVDDNHLVTAWQFYEGGKVKNTENFEYVRVR